MSPFKSSFSIFLSVTNSACALCFTGAIRGFFAAVLQRPLFLLQRPLAFGLLLVYKKLGELD
jgi:hypothetical protein